MNKSPWQEDGESLDIKCQDYDILERIHKYEAWTDDQLHHYEVGWEAAMTYYKKWFRKEP